MGRIYAIALNAYREAIRDRVLIGVVGVAAASLLLGLSLAWLTIAEQVTLLVDHGVVTISWLANLVAIFLGASFLYKEIELRTLYVILAKPVARWEFVVGKYLGIITTAVVFIAITASLLLVLLDLQTAETVGPPGTGLAWLARQVLGSRRARVALVALALAIALLLGAAARRVPVVARVRDALGAALTAGAALLLLGACAAIARVVAPVETRYVLLAAALVAGEVVITAAVATLVSSFSTPFVTGMITLGVFIVGRSAGAMTELRARQLPASVRQLLRGVATVVPNLQLYVRSRPLLLPAETALGPGPYLAQTFGYALLYAALLLTGAALLFRRRDLT